MKTKNRIKWGKNYNKPTKAFKKVCILRNIRTELANIAGFPVSFFYRKEDEDILNKENVKPLKYNSAIQLLKQDIVKMKKIALQYASRLSRKNKKRFKKHLW